MAEVLQDGGLDGLQLLPAVGILHVGHRDAQLAGVRVVIELPQRLHMPTPGLTPHVVAIRTLLLSHIEAQLTCVLGTTRPTWNPCGYISENLWVALPFSPSPFGLHRGQAKRAAWGGGIWQGGWMVPGAKGLTLFFELSDCYSLYEACTCKQGCASAYPVGKGVREVHAQHAASLVAPAAGNIAHRVPAASQDQHGHIEVGQELDAVGVALQAEVEAAQAVPR